MHTCRRIAVVMALLVLGLPGPAAAQSEKATLSGRVTDPQGAVIVGAEVGAININTNISVHTVTNNEGLYVISNLLPGRYRITVRSSGFREIVTTDVILHVQDVVAQNFTMQVGSTSQSVTVSAGGIRVDTENQQLSQVVDDKQVSMLPLLTRNPYDLVAIAGNVSEGDPQNQIARGAGVQVNGQRSDSTNVLLDGAENLNAYDATIGQSVPLDSMQEFRIISSNFSAEFGRASGGIVNVTTKSGTNNLHGTLYEFNRVSKLASNTFDNVANGRPKGVFARNQFGYSIGGPIIKNKLFFFQSTEWVRVRSHAQQIMLVPTPQLITASAPNTRDFFAAEGALRPSATIGRTYTNSDLAGAGISPGPVLAALGPSFPVFQTVNFVVPADAGGGSPQNYYSLVGRVDYALSDKTILFVRYARQHEDDFPGTISFSPYADQDVGQNSRNNSGVVSITHLFTSNVINETKLAANRFDFGQPLSPIGLVPTLQFGPLPASLFGHFAALPVGGTLFGGIQNLTQVSDNLSWTRGAHQFAFGGEYVYVQDNRTLGAFLGGSETLGRAGDLPSALDNLLTGRLRQFQGALDPQGKFPCRVDQSTFPPTPIVTPECSVTTPVGAPNVARSNRFHDVALYALDRWKLTRRFTLNLGFRWDYFGVQRSASPALESNFYLGSGSDPWQAIRNGQVAITPNSPIKPQGLWLPRYRNFAPRIGFAWDVFGDSKTSLRGGYGIYYERNMGAVSFNVIQNPPNNLVLSLIAPRDIASLDITTCIFGPACGANGTQYLPQGSLRAMRQDLKTAYSNIWSLSLERKIAENTVAALEYSGSHGVQLYSIDSVNRLGSGVIYAGDNFPLSRLNDQYTGINLRGNSGFLHYNALNVKLNSNNLFHLGLQLTANYTFAHTIDNLSNTFSESNNNFNVGPLDPFNPSLDKGNAEYDIRHRFVVSAVWEIPKFGNSNSRFVRQLLDGWTVASIFNARTGTPFSVFDCTNAAEACPRYIPGGPFQAQVTSNPSPTGSPNLYNILSLPGSDPFPDLGGVGYYNLATGVSDFGQCDTPGDGALGKCQWPANMTRRNQFRGPGYWNVNLGLYKTFKVTERINLQFRSEMFDTFNHHNFYINGAMAEVATLGGGPDTPFSILAQKGGLGKPNDERRHIQFALRVIF